MINLQTLTPLLSAGKLILTPNNRLKNKVLLAWTKAQTGVVRAPNVLSLGDWIDQQWQQRQRAGDSQTHKLLASTQLRRQLWAQVLKESESADPLVHPRLLIDQLDQAYTYLKLWQVQDVHWQPYRQTMEMQRLEGWITNFDGKLQQFGLCSDEQRLAYLTANVTKQSAADVHLLNFDTLSPLHEQLLHAAFSELCYLNSNQQPAQQAVRVMCKDPKHELQAAAHWAFTQLQDNPNQQIAIIDPNLGKNRARLERHLARVFEPTHHLPNCPRYTMPFNFSAGTPLAQCPVIHQFIATMRWPKSPDQLLAWLQSPFMGVENDQAVRHWLSARLLELGSPEIGMQTLIATLELAQGHDFLGADAIVKGSNHPSLVWQNGLQEIARWPARATGRQWAQLMLSTLTLFNWPGPRKLDSEEHQQVNQFLQLLEQLTEADHLGQPLTASEASHWLAELASRQPFQPQTPESPLQVLGTLESAGLAFDQIWLLGMDDTQWPPAAAPNPLIPAQLQRDLQMPHASADKELDFCQRLTHNFLHAAASVTMSYAARDGDRELSPSPLIIDLAAGREPNVPEASLVTAAFEWLETLTAPPISPAELANLRGGSAMLQKQARCPLAAFMEVRLGARRPDTAKPGLNALDRGNLLHQALFYFWQANPNLNDLSESARDAAIGAALDAACAEFPDLVHRRFMTLERQRLTRLLIPWLNYEKDRPAFQILGLEQSHNFTLGPLPLTLRLDRIDKVDGQWLLIDYKSGTTRISSWLGDRPEEPQLPLYAVALSDAGEPVAAIAFAELRQKSQLLQGVGAANLAQGLRSPEDKAVGFHDWPALVSHWRHALLTLAQELVDGHCPLAFSSSQSAQYLSHLAPLLRLSEQQQLADPGKTPEVTP